MVCGWFLALLALLVCLSLRGRAGPGRRPGNFHLLAQMKVTKAKGLNTHLVNALGRKELATGSHR